MKIKNKQILIILISAAIVFSVYGYISMAQITAPTKTGYIILMDQRISTSDYSFLDDRIFDSVIYLPSENAEGTVTSCGFVFPEGVNEKADITGDGRIDYVDIQLFAEAYGCNSGDDCWNEAFKTEECYFVSGSRLFQDPTRDCKIDQSDLDVYSGCYGSNPVDPFTKACNNNACCRADVNKDGTVDLKDYALVGSNFGKYAQVYQNFIKLKKSDADISGNGKVDLADYFAASKSYGYEADEWKCTRSSLIHINGFEYQVTASARGLNYVSVSYAT